MPSFAPVFVCTSERAADHPRGSCARRGAVAVRELLKKELTARGLAGRVRANAAGCLDQCERGVAIVVYPEQVWYGAVTAADVTEIIERHLVGGEIVERLLMPDQPHHGEPRHRLPVLAPGGATS
ncbi:MAG: (2Fe-2S) ferredoxin domain-containing protein [Kofleriaceae bacterium]